MTNWPVAPFGRETYSVFESRLPYKNKGVMAEWLMRGTVNTFFRGSIPLDTLNLKTKKVKFIEAPAAGLRQPPSEGGGVLSGSATPGNKARATACLSLRAHGCFYK